MAKFCPDSNEKVTYLDCLECETKTCRKASQSVTEDIKLNNDIKEDNKEV